MTDRYDVVVIGAGPAGGLSALLAARAGARTLLVDRGSWPREKVCGCCLAERGQSVLMQAGIGGELLAKGRALPIARLRVRTAKREAGFDIPGYTTIRRRDMDEAIVQAAQREGAEFIPGVRAEIDRSERMVTLHGESTRDVRFAVAIAADGLGGSSLRGDPAFDWITRESSHVGIGGVAEAGASCSFDRDAITMHVGGAGYVGVAPLPGGAWSIAAALAPSAVRDQGGPKPAVASILKAASVRTDWLDGVTLTGTPPLTRRRSAVEADGRVFVVGDAAGYVEPFTGEGMSWALAGAARLSPLVLEAVSGRYRAGTWTARRSNDVQTAQRGCRVVASLLRRPRLMSGVVAAASVLPSLGSMLSRAVIGHRAGAVC